MKLYILSSFVIILAIGALTVSTPTSLFSWGGVGEGDTGSGDAGSGNAQGGGDGVGGGGNDEGGAWGGDAGPGPVDGGEDEGVGGGDPPITPTPPDTSLALVIDTTMIEVGETAELSWDASPVMYQCPSSATWWPLNYGTVIDVYRCSSAGCVISAVAGDQIRSDIRANNGWANVGSGLGTGVYRYRIYRPSAQYHCYDEGSTLVPATWSNYVNLTVTESSAVGIDVMSFAPPNPGVLERDQAHVFSAAVRNIGDVSSGQFRSRILLQQNVAGAWTTINNAPQAEAPLPPLSTRSVTQTWTPSDVGRYRVRTDILDATSPQTYPDTDLTNNASNWRYFDVIPGAPGINFETRVGTPPLVGTGWNWSTWAPVDRSVAYNELVRLRWTTTDADSCTLAQDSNPSDTVAVPTDSPNYGVPMPLLGTTEGYILSCMNSVGDSTVTREITVGDRPALPTVSVWHSSSSDGGTTWTPESATSDVHIVEGDDIRVRWEATNAVRCERRVVNVSNPSFTDPTAPVAGIDDTITEPVPSDAITRHALEVKCYNAIDDWRLRRVFVTGVAYVAAPVTLTAEPRAVRAGETVNLTWDVNGNPDCTLTGPVQNHNSVFTGDSNGSGVSRPIAGQTTFTLTCGSQSDSVTVLTAPAQQER